MRKLGRRRQVEFNGRNAVLALAHPLKRMGILENKMQPLAERQRIIVRAIQEDPHVTSLTVGRTGIIRITDEILRNISLRITMALGVSQQKASRHSDLSPEDLWAHAIGQLRMGEPDELAMREPTFWFGLLTSELFSGVVYPQEVHGKLSVFGIETRQRVRVEQQRLRGRSPQELRRQRVPLDDPLTKGNRQPTLTVPQGSAPVSRGRNGSQPQRAKPKPKVTVDLDSLVSKIKTNLLSLPKDVQELICYRLSKVEAALVNAVKTGLSFTLVTVAQTAGSEIPFITQEAIGLMEKLDDPHALGTTTNENFLELHRLAWQAKDAFGDNVVAELDLSEHEALLFERWLLASKKHLLSFKTFQRVEKAQEQPEIPYTGAKRSLTEKLKAI